MRQRLAEREAELVAVELAPEEHRDDLGHREIIRAGHLQRITAGTGIRHSEANPSADEEVHLLQIWIVPEKRGLKPSYAERSAASVKDGEVALIASKGGRDGSMAINQDADLLLARLATGQKATHRLAPGRHAWVHVAEGEVNVNGETLRAGDALALSEESAVELAGVTPAQALIFDLN